MSEVSLYLNPRPDSGLGLLKWSKLTREKRMTTQKTPGNTFEPELIVFLQIALAIDSGGGTQDKKMSKGHLPRVVYHQVYNRILKELVTLHPDIRIRRVP